jgi:hypothetical protein
MMPPVAPIATGKSFFSDWAGRLTLLGAELLYLGLVIYLAKITWESAANTVPSVSAGIAGTTAALATAFGVGYASLLGVPPSGQLWRAPEVEWWRKVWHWVTAVLLTQNNLLGAGVFLYMGAGATLGVTYLWNQSESPGIVKTIAVAFGGYVIAYIGTAY